MPIEGVVHSVAVGQGISCHAWNKDRSMIALCPNSHIVQIFKVPSVTDSSKQWELLHELNQHDQGQIVTGLDWAPNTDRIVTCSQDRNAYVWNFEKNLEGEMEWKPTLVILRVNRAATTVRWNSEETKFAVGSGSKCVSICYYEAEMNLWVSKLVKKHKSTVLSVSWHPTLPILATACSDLKCRVVSAYVKNIDAKELNKSNPFDTEGGGKLGLGDVLREFPCASWVHSVMWSPSGLYLAFCSHDSTVHIASMVAPDFPVQSIKLAGLPLRSLQFLNDSVMVGAGYEVNPQVFTESGGNWALKGKLDAEKKKEVVKEQTQAKKAFEMFQSQAKKADSSSSTSEVLPTKHQNSITCFQPFTSSGTDTTTFSSSGLDGLVVHWTVPSVSPSAIEPLLS